MYLIACLALLASSPAGLPSKHADQTDRIALLVASTDGATRETAYKVDSVDEEYQILAARHLKPGEQDLIIGDDKKPYDLLKAIDPATGETHELWFDIGSFFGKEF